MLRHASPCNSYYEMSKRRDQAVTDDGEESYQRQLQYSEQLHLSLFGMNVEWTYEWRTFRIVIVPQQPSSVQPVLSRSYGDDVAVETQVQTGTVCEHVTTSRNCFAKFIFWDDNTSTLRVYASNEVQFRADNSGAPKEMWWNAWNASLYYSGKEAFMRNIRAEREIFKRRSYQVDWERTGCWISGVFWQLSSLYLPVI